MKKTLLVLCLLSTTAAFAQYGGVASYISGQPQVFQPPSHPEHAAYGPMSQERSVLAATSYSLEQGDRRASDFPQTEAAVSLGAFAREFRKQHSKFKKARVVWVNQ
jgi:hypothetical protein